MIRSFQLKNFKALKNSGVVKFTPLTVFIGNNGSGKSSLIEGLKTYRDILVQGMDPAMYQWRGYEHIHNPPLSLVPTGEEMRGKTAPIEFTLTGDAQNGGQYRTSLALGITPNGDQIYIDTETLKIRNRMILEKKRTGDSANGDRTQQFLSSLNFSMLSAAALGAVSSFMEQGGVDNVMGDVMSLTNAIIRWQFLTLDPYKMGVPQPQRRTMGALQLSPDGSNIAEYLLDIRNRDIEAFNEIVETLQYVMPYVSDLQPTLTFELERMTYLQLTEGSHKIPGWLLSTGTLRILALLAVLKNPEPPPLIIIEEIENGLDPRAINLVVEEVRSITESGTSQIIATTHSPYLLDLLDLEHIVVVERTDGQPTFFRPSTDQALRKWAESFTPGRLYTMSQLTRRSAE